MHSQKRNTQKCANSIIEIENKKKKILKERPYVKSVFERYFLKVNKQPIAQIEHLFKKIYFFVNNLLLRTATMIITASLDLISGLNYFHI